MKYFKAAVLVGFADADVNNWSEQADLTFGLARKLHDPEREMYLIGYGDEPIEASERSMKALKYSVITPEGGV